MISFLLGLLCGAVITLIASFAVRHLFAKNTRLDQLLSLALRPVESAVENLRTQTEEIERRRSSTIDSLAEQVKHLGTSARSLSSALSHPGVRGNLGEVMLRRVVENAGLVEGQNFVVQDTSVGETGTLKPDMVIKLPRGREVVVDSKLPLDAYQRALESTDETARAQHLADHVKSVRAHIKRLTAKSYWSRYSGSPSYTVMFVGAESAYYCAIDTDPGLLEYASEAKVILASPTTFVALVHAVAHLLDEERLAMGSEELRLVATKLYDSLRSFMSCLSKVGKSLKTATDAFNDAVGVLGKTVVPHAKSLRSLGAGPGEEITKIETLNGHLADVSELI